MIPIKLYISTTIRKITIPIITLSQKTSIDLSNLYANNK